MGARRHRRLRADRASARVCWSASRAYARTSPDARAPDRLRRTHLVSRICASTLADAAHRLTGTAGGSSADPVADPDPARSAHHRPDRQPAVVLAVDRAEHIEVTLDTTGLRTGRHHAPGQRPADVEHGRADGCLVAVERGLGARRRAAGWRGSGAGPTPRCCPGTAARHSPAPSRGRRPGCRRTAPSGRSRPRSRLGSRSGADRCRRPGAGARGGRASPTARCRRARSSRRAA